MTKTTQTCELCGKRPSLQTSQRGSFYAYRVMPWGENRGRLVCNTCFSGWVQELGQRRFTAWFVSA